MPPRAATHQHDAEPHVEGVVQLQHLGHKRGRLLQPRRCERAADRALQVHVILYIRIRAV